MKDVTFIQFIPVLHAENFVPMLFFCGRLCPQRGYRHMTSDFDICENDLDMQMSFLKAVP